MQIAARRASPDDLNTLMGLYRDLEAEQTSLKKMWPLADALAEPADTAMKEALVDPETAVFLGTIDDLPLGFLMIRSEPLLPQAGEERVASIRFVYTDHDARGVGVGEAMIDAALGEFRERGFTRFDAYVLPGHRFAKNFFESAGFAARSIVMHHDDGRTS
jgi:ribosomal protein S18 acetylase RimI-like enzyme